MTRALRQTVKWFYLLSAFLLIALAIAVQSGRSLSPLLGNYTQDIEAYFSEKFNAQVTIGSIDANWDGLKPSLDLKQLNILNHSGEPIFAFERARVRLDILGSLVNLRWVWSNIILSNVQMDFVQQSSGKWRVRGLPVTQPDADDAGLRLDSLVDMLLLSNRIEFQGSRLGFHFVDGRQAELNTPLLLFENANDFHRLSLQVDVDGEARRVYLMLESEGDPRKRAHTRGYLQLNQFPTSEPVAALNAFLLHGVDNSKLKAEGNVSANIWFESRPDDDGFAVTGNIKLERLLVPFTDHPLQLTGFSGDLVGHWLYGGSWQLGVQQIEATYLEHKISDLNLGFKYGGNLQPLQVHLNQLDLIELRGMLDDIGSLGTGRVQDIVKNLAPKGKLNNLRLDLPLGKPADWQLSANVEGMAVNALQGVPALTGVDGFLQLGRNKGFISLDSRAGFSMHYIPTYERAMEYDRMRGQIAWHLDPDNNQVYINSGPLTFYQGEESVTGFMWLSMPWRRNTGDIDLYLHIGGHDLNAGLYRKYLPALAPASLRTWLDQSIGNENPGVARTAGFIYRATLNSKDPNDRSFDLYLDLVRSKLNYSEGWPALNNLTGRLLVSNADVKASVSRAQIYESQIESAQIRVTPRQGRGSLLKVAGVINGSTADGMRILREGTLRRTIGNSMDTWSMDGEMRTTLDLAIPLGTGQAKPAGSLHKVDVDLQARTFELKNLNLVLKDLTGRVSYNSNSGLTSKDLAANLFGEPITAEISTQQLDGYSQTRINMTGAVESRTLAAWSKRPEIFFLEGKLPYTTLVEINHRPRATIMSEEPVEQSAESFAGKAIAKVSVVSNLKGVKIDLPGAYSKTPKSKRSLAFTMWLQERESQAEVKYADKVQALFRLDRENNSRLLNASIALDKTAAFSTTPEFLISGHLPDFDVTAWKNVLLRYQDFRSQLGEVAEAEQSEQSIGQIAGLPFRGDLILDHYEVGNLHLEKIAVGVRRDASGWQLALKNPIIEGNLLVPEVTNAPLQVNLNYLHLTQQDLDKDETPASADPSATDLEKSITDPSKLPLANIAVKELHVDQQHLGSWSLQLRPNSKGVVIDRIHGSIRGVTIDGVDDTQDGAKIIWQRDDEGEKTRFIGSMSAGDIADVMRQWNKPDPLESKAAKFTLDIYWAGSPQQFELVDINGDMRLWFEQGRFKRDVSAEDGILRLMSVLNFDSLARRMRMDFSDLYQSGLAYDQINGKVHFNQGTMEFVEPLEVRGPSSRLQMVGSLNLRQESIDARLIATLPVAGNLTFFTALVTGLPAAAGIYVVSKLFKKQVDQVTSISYTIEGGWDKPQMRFDRLFESEDSLRDSVKNKTPSSKLRRPEDEEVDGSSS